MSRLVSLLRRRGLVLPSFEIYGGVSGLVDYGPVGARIKRRVIDAWIEHWGSITNVVEIDSPPSLRSLCLSPADMLESSTTKCQNAVSCGGAFRSDHLVAEFHEAPDTLSSSELDDLIEREGVRCPSCTHSTGKGNADESNVPDQHWSNGRIEDRISEAETAQGMFMLFPACTGTSDRSCPSVRCRREGIQERNQSETGDD